MRIAKDTEENRWGGGTDPRKDPEYLCFPANQWMKRHYKGSTPVQLLPVCGPERGGLVFFEASSVLALTGTDTDKIHQLCDV